MPDLQPVGSVWKPQVPGDEARLATVQDEVALHEQAESRLGTGDSLDALGWIVGKRSDGRAQSRRVVNAGQDRRLVDGGIGVFIGPAVGRYVQEVANVTSPDYNLSIPKSCTLRKFWGGSPSRLVMSRRGGTAECVNFRNETGSEIPSPEEFGID